MSTSVLEIDSGRVARTRALLEAMPDSLFNALKNPSVTADICSNVVVRAMRSRNPRVVREWLDYERAPIAPSEAVACLDLALSLEMRGVTDSRMIAFSRAVRDEAARHIGGPGSGEPVTEAPVSDVIEGILMAIGAFSPALVKHSRNVASLAKRLGKAADLNSPALEKITNAALVHDLGRLRIDRSRSDSQAAFSENEREQIRMDLAETSTFDSRPGFVEIADVVYGLYCAESYVASTEIRILRVADAFVSMCESRAYRDAFAPREALDEMWGLRGGRLDSDCLDLLADLLGYRRRYAQTA